MKVIAMYLPQFHRVKENDEWWGEGFTDWTAVKNAVPLFDGHYQPRVPLNNNYYNLLDKKTMLWQAELMKKYDVYGMCFHHYWFKDGRRILEKPAENLLKWTDINMPFCFSWDSTSWARTWSNLENSFSWAKKFEISGDATKDNGVLLEQDFGDIVDWKEHFEYLLPFFKDNRYIKHNGKPVFIFYHAAGIPCINEMISYWNELSIEYCLPGIYFIGGNTHSKYTLDAVLHIEPQTTMRTYLANNDTDNLPKTIDYCDICNNIIYNSINIFTNFGLFTGYDDTPRRGNSGIVVTDATPELFRKYMNILLKLNEIAGNEYLFINAWNEWGEGMYLEPDERHGFEYLEAIKESLQTYREEPCTKVELYKFLIKTFFNNLKKSNTRIVVYGAGKNGLLLVDAAKYYDCPIVYMTDSNSNLHGTVLSGVEIVSKKKALADADVILISVGNMQESYKIAADIKNYYIDTPVPKTITWNDMPFTRTILLQNLELVHYKVIDVYEN